MLADKDRIFTNQYGFLRDGFCAVRKLLTNGDD